MPLSSKNHGSYNSFKRVKFGLNENINNQIFVSQMSFFFKYCTAFTMCVKYALYKQL